MRICLPILSAFILASCDSPESETKKRGEYQSTATVQIYQSPILPKSDRFLTNQIALLTTSPIIAAASEASGIDSETISSALEVEVIEGTDLFTISAHHDDKGRAQKMVQAVLDSYRGHRKKVEIDNAKKKLAALDEELIKQDDLVQKNQTELTNLIQSYGTPYSIPSEVDLLGRTEEQMFESARKKLVQFETQRDQIETSIKKLDEMKNPELVRYAAGLDLPENQVTYYYTQHREALQKRGLLIAQGLGAIHPDVLASEKRAKGALANAVTETTSLITILKTKLELIKMQIEKMKSMVENRKSEDENLSERQKNYNDAKATYEEARDQLRSLKISRQESRILLEKDNPAFIIHGWDHD
jgi:hypothetical protein